MKLGLTDQERDEADRDRRAINCLRALAVLAVVASAILAWIGLPA